MNQQDWNSRVIMSVLLALVSWGIYTQSNRFTSDDGARVETRIEDVTRRVVELEKDRTAYQAAWEVRQIKKWIEKQEEMIHEHEE